MKKIAAPLKFCVLSLVLCLGLSGCVKDVDLEQVNEIRLQPTVVVDLVSFDLEADLSRNIDPGVPIRVEKTVPFEILTEDLKEDLIGVDFRFDYYNSLPRTFSGYVIFLNDRGRERLRLPIEILPGNKEKPTVDYTLHSIVDNELQAFHQATQVKVELEMQPGPGLEGGQLKLQSTASFKFEF